MTVLAPAASSVACGRSSQFLRTSADMGDRTNTEEDDVSEPRGVKTLGIKVPDALHAQFTLVAQLDGISLNDAALRAVELYVSAKRQEPDFAQRAAAALEEIEKEAAARRASIEGLFGTSAEAVADAAGAAKPATSRSRKAGTEG
ncbi:hypothetical protein [Amycolatopsis sp. cmx-4-68]|uniref:hypothetical protein n=1 Tax=Amycolatopsis sp. cmx-4-68 TaxID=2790938 RepID=UPI00397951A1